MNAIDLQREIMDEAIKSAAAMHTDFIASQYTDEASFVLHSFSNAHEKKMEAMFTNNRSKSSYNKLNTKILKTTVAVFLLLMLAVFTISSVSADKLLNTKLSVSEDGTSIQINIGSQQVNYLKVSDQIHGLCLPEYLPDGFEVSELQKEEDSNIAYYLTFQNAAGREIDLIRFADDAQIGIGNEKTAEKIQLNGEEATILDSENNFKIFYGYNGCKFMVCGEDKEELIKIASSMRYYK